MSKRPWWRRRWVIALAVVVALLIAVRVALPVVLRRVLVAQGSARVAGRFEVADVDLWLLRGAVAIEGVEMVGDAGTSTSAAGTGSALPTSAASPAPGAASGTASTAPRLALHRLLVDIRWLPLLHRTIEFDEITLDGLELDAERDADGALLLPGLRPTDAAAAPPPAPESPPGEPAQPWNVIVDAARLRRGKLVLVDHVAHPAETVTLALDGLEVLGFHLLRDTEGEPGKGTIEAHFGDGTLRLSTSVTTRSEGFALAATLDLENLPLDRLNAHVPQLGWSDFRGRLDGALEVNAEPNALPIVSGTVALRDVQVDVPGESEPALAWRRFDVDLERLDIERRQVALRRVALEGAGVLVRPRDPLPLPLLPRPAAAEPHKAAPVSVRAEPAGSSRPWTWSVATVEVKDTMAKVFLEPPPLEIAIPAAKVEGLSSAPGNRATVALEVREGPGTVTLAGDLAIAPLAAKLHLTMDAIALERGAAAAGVTPPILRRGNLSGDLQLAFGDGPAIVSGKVALADLDVAPPTGDDFALGWKRLEIALREARLPNVPPSAGAQASSEPMKVDLERVALSSPKVRLTRTADGIVLPAVSLAPADGAAEPGVAPQPSAGAAADAAAAADASPSPAVSVAAPDASPTPAAPPSPVTEDAAAHGAAAPAANAAVTNAPAPPVLQLDLAELAIDDGEVAVVDRSVKPFFRGSLAKIAIAAHGLAYPANRFHDVRLTAQAPGGTPLEVQAQQKGSAIDVTLNAERLALPPLNPYVTGAAGYSISSGTFTLASKLHWAEDGYKSESNLAFDDLDVAGIEGDSLFAQRFGVSLTLALALMRDVSGRIALNVPITGDRTGGARPDLAPIVSEALAHALLNALASPLKLLGALSFDGGKVSAFAPEPIGFVAGGAAVDDASWWRIEQLANVAAASPALRIELAGTAGASDVRALQEAAVLADLQADQGVLGSLRNLPSRGARNAVRDALQARAKGEPATLDPDDAAKLEEWVAAKSIGDDQLQQLARDRQQRLRDVLAQDYGLGEDRVGLLDPVAEPTADTTVVRVKIGAR